MKIKHILLSFVLVLSLKISVGQDLLKVGDNIYSYLQENPIKYNNPNNKMCHWIEGNIGLYSYTKGGQTNKPYILHTCGGKFLFGILQGANPDAHYIFDMDGDRVLDYRTDTFVLPSWVIEANSPNRSQENNLSSVMELMYESFNSNLGPSNPKMTEALLSLKSFYQDTTMTNRDLVGMLEFYIVNANRPDLAIYAISKFEMVYNDRFNKNHPLINLYKGETFMNLGQDDNALIEFKKVIKADENFIPALVYICQLEENVELSEENLKKIKVKYPDHWIVKNL